MRPFLLALFLVGCASSTIPRPKPVQPTDTDDCAAACTKLQELKCPEGDPLPPSSDHPSGATCETFCRETQDNGHSLSPSCVKKIRSCADMQTIQYANSCPF